MTLGRVVRLGIAVGIEHPLEHAVHGARRAPPAVAEDARGHHADVRRHRGHDLGDLGAVPVQVLVERRLVLVVGVEPGARRGRELREAGQRGPCRAPRRRRRARSGPAPRAPARRSQ